MSTNNYAWDLVNNLAKNETDLADDIDMANLSDSSYTFPPYYFINSWSAQNTTMFKRANQVDYNSVSLVEAVDAYTGGSISVVPSPTATGLTMGDVYIAKLRGQEDYAVIQVTNIEWTDNNSLDKIEFRYKK